MSALNPQLRAFLDEHRVGVLATAARDGRPRQSVVYFAREGDALVVSTLEGRRKVEDVRRTGWASLSARGDAMPYPSATFSGPAEIITEDIATPTAAIMARLVSGAPAPDPLSEAELAAAGRVILRIAVDRVAAVTHVG
jgi:PPOX class probable F420-dependent enzyme